MAFCGILWHYGILWHCGILWHFVAFLHSLVLWHSVAFCGIYCGVLWHCGILWHFEALWNFVALWHFVKLWHSLAQWHSVTFCGTLISVTPFLCSSFSVCLQTSFSAPDVKNMFLVDVIYRRIQYYDSMTDLLMLCAKNVEIVRHFQSKLCGEKTQLCGKLWGKFGDPQLTSPPLSWDRIKPRYFLKAQGQSFHFCIIVLRFLAAFAIAKIAFVGRHRTHITNGHCTRYAWIFCIWTVRQWQTEHLLSIAAEDCCYVRQNIVLNAGVTFGRVHVQVRAFDVGQ